VENGSSRETGEAQQAQSGGYSQEKSKEKHISLRMKTHKLQRKLKKIKEKKKRDGRIALKNNLKGHTCNNCKWSEKWRYFVEQGDPNYQRDCYSELRKRILNKKTSAMSARTDLPILGERF
jgi:hypothetical protein